MSKLEKEDRALQRRRMRAGRLLLRGVPQAEVARRVAVTRTTVSAWNEQLNCGGLQGLRRRPRGRPSGLDGRQKVELVRLLKDGALAQGFATELWTLRRVGQLIAEKFGRRYSESQVWRILVGLGFSSQRPTGRALERDEAAIRHWKRKRWPALKKNARKQGRIIVFIDESGLSERPTQVRGWAPRGETPVLQYHFNWHQLSAMAGITFYRFYFRLFPGAIKGPQVIEFLDALGRQIRRKVLVIWDGLPAHRSRVVRDYIESLKGAIQLEYLPAYAPELNPTEYIWGHLKHHELANFCARTFGELTCRTRNRLRSMQRRQTLISAFWQQAELPL
ncbi:MAG: IS630 family transposase [Steroidobacteraceae bacterium]